MSTNRKRADDIVREVTEFAKRHGLIAANADCLAKHAQRFIELGRGPCVEGRLECPCADVLADMERLGRCECGILIDPERICVPRVQSESKRKE